MEASLVNHEQKSTWRDEFIAVVSVGLPVIIRVFVEVATDRVPLTLVSKYDGNALHFDSYFLASTYIIITSESLALGTNAAVYTFASQYFGEGSPHKMGALFWAYCKVAGVLVVISMVLNVFCADILAFAGQEATLIPNTAKIAHVIMLFQPLFWIQYGVIPILDSQGYTSVGVWSLIVRSMFCIVPTWCLLHWGYGYMDAVLVRGISYVPSCLITFYLVYKNSLAGCTFALNDQPSFSVSRFLKMSVPLSIGVWVEWWAQESLVLIAGYLPNPSLHVAAHGVLLNFYTLVNPVFIGIGLGGYIRIGSHVGGNRPGSIVRCALSALGLSFLSTLVLCLIFYCYREEIVPLFTSRRDVVEVVRGAWMPMLVCLACFSLAFPTAEMLRGAGLQMPVVLIFAVGFWCIGIPCGYFAGVVCDVGLAGIWYGNALALAVSFGMLIFYFMRRDWSEICRERILIEERHNKIT